MRYLVYMARQARLKAVYLKSRGSWAVNVPASLSDTGKRRQLFFPTKSDANVACEKLRTRKDNFGISLTAITPARIAEAGEALKLLEPIGVSLLDAVRDYVAGYKRRNESISFEALFNLFLEAKADRNPAYLHELRVTRDRDEMRNLHDRLVCDIGPRDLEPILNTMTPGARNPVMRYLRAVFNYGIKRGYLTENPINRLDFVVRPRQEVKTIPVKQVAGMLNHALENDLELLPFLVFGFFAGIRPEGELVELEWSDVKTDEIVIRPEVSKTNRRRFIDISDNAKAWLQTYADRGGVMTGKVVRCSASELRARRTANWKAAGIRDWPQQGMRHTFCSCWLAVHHDINRLVLMSGHDSVDTMWRAYHAGIPEAEAQKFWSIRPPTPATNIIPMARIG
jgi:integrase